MVIWHLPVIVSVTACLLVEFANLELYLINSGQYDAARYPPIGLMAVNLALLFGGTFSGYFKKEKPSENSDSVPVVPHPIAAVATICTVRTKLDTSLGSATGWIWIEGPWLIFESETFGFKLSVQDFQSTLKAKTLFDTSRLALVGDHPLSRISIQLTSTEVMTTSDTVNWQSRVDAWKSYAAPYDSSLFPPLRPNDRSQVPPIRSWLPMYVITAAITWAAFRFGSSSDLRIALQASPHNFELSIAVIVFCFMTLFGPALPTLVVFGIRWRQRQIDELASGRN